MILRTDILCLPTVSPLNSRSQWMEGELKASSEVSSGWPCHTLVAKEPTMTAIAQTQSGHAGVRWATSIAIAKG